MNQSSAQDTENLTDGVSAQELEVGPDCFYSDLMYYVFPSVINCSSSLLRKLRRIHQMRKLNLHWKRELLIRTLRLIQISR